MRIKKKIKLEHKESQPPIEIVNIEDDDPFFTPVLASSKRNAISVDKERDDLLTTAGNLIDLSDETLTYFDGDEDLVVLTSKPLNTPFGKRKRKPFTGPSVTEVGESSNSNSRNDSSFVCEICIDPKSRSDSFAIKNCHHYYCTECMIKYVASKLQENITSIKCPAPDCEGVLEPEHCQPILPPEVFERWGSALCEAMILGSQKFYCPFKDCSGMLVDDGGEVVQQSVCPNCWRMFCAQCKVPWHAGINCTDFQKLHKDEREKEDLMLRNLAQKKEWKRCPKCRFYVEKAEGCMFMECRCRTSFCYRCEHLLESNHGHYCPNCM